MMKEKNIKIDIAGRSFSIKVNEKDVSVIQKASEQINEKMNELEKTYKVRDRYDLLAMSVLQYVLEVNNSSSNNQQLDEHVLIKQIEDINSLIPEVV